MSLARVSPLVTTLARLFLGGLFVVAGALKLGEPTAFATEIANYRFLPQLAPYLATTLPMIELTVGLALLVAPLAWRRAAALASIGLLLVFTVAVAHVVRAGINVDCGCFGGRSGPVNVWTLARDLGLLGVAALLYVTSRSRVTHP